MKVGKKILPGCVDQGKGQEGKELSKDVSSDKMQAYGTISFKLYFLCTEHLS